MFCWSRSGCCEEPFEFLSKKQSKGFASSLGIGSFQLFVALESDFRFEVLGLVFKAEGLGFKA